MNFILRLSLRVLVLKIVLIRCNNNKKKLAGGFKNSG